jgi:hypothetical protein
VYHIQVHRHPDIQAGQRTTATAYIIPGGEKLEIQSSEGQIKTKVCYQPKQRCLDDERKQQAWYDWWGETTNVDAEVLSKKQAWDAGIKYMQVTGGK